MAPGRPRLALTLGDPRGIGPEIVAAALADPTLTARFEPVEGYQEGSTGFVKALTTKPVGGVGRVTAAAACGAQSASPSARGIAPPPPAQPAPRARGCARTPSLRHWESAA